MTLLRNKYLFWPLIFLFVLFSLDKLFLLPGVRDRFIQPGGMMYYRQRETQLETLRRDLRKAPSREKQIIVLGDSRSFAIGSVVAKFVGYPQYKVYNFAGPQALPVYHSYMAEQIFMKPERPGYLFLMVAPDSFNKNSGILFSPNMNWGLPAEYIERFRDKFPEKDYERYETSRRFALPGMQFSFKKLIERFHNTISSSGGGDGLAEMMMIARTFKGAIDSRNMNEVVTAMAGVKNEDLSVYSLEKSPYRKVLDYLGGAQYSWFGFMSDDKLREETERLTGIYLKRFEISEDQFFFLEKTLRHARDSGTKTVVFMPLLNPYLKKAYAETEVISAVKERIQKEAHRYGATYIDLNDVPEAACSQFYDASHLSINCFPDIVRVLMQTLEKN